MFGAWPEADQPGHQPPHHRHVPDDEQGHRWNRRPPARKQGDEDCPVEDPLDRLQNDGGHPAAPLHRGAPGYRRELDADGDGVACEPYGRKR